MGVVVDRAWICFFLFRLSAPADKSQDGFSGEQLLVPRCLFRETADIEVLSVQVVFQYPVDFSYIHGIAEEHSFSMVGQWIQAIGLMLKAALSVDQGIADDVFGFFRSVFHKTPQQESAGVIDGDGVYS